MKKLTKIVEMISSEMKGEEIAKIYLENIEVDDLYKEHLHKDFKKIIENYRDKKTDEMCRSFIIYLETLLNFHIGENLNNYKKLTSKYQNQNLLMLKKLNARYQNTEEKNWKWAKKILSEEKPINHIDSYWLSFKLKCHLFSIFNLVNSQYLSEEINECYKVRNYLCHGYKNPNFSQKPINLKAINKILEEDVNIRVLNILRILEIYNYAANKKNHLEELLNIDSKEMINNKKFLKKFLENLDKKFLNETEKEYKKQIIKEINKNQKEEKMDKSINETLNNSSSKNTNNQTDFIEIGEDILEEINLYAGMIDTKDIGEDILEEINLHAGIIDTKGIGEDILEEINFHAGIIDTKEIENILCKIDVNSNKIDPEDVMEILYEIEKRMI